MHLAENFTQFSHGSYHCQLSSGPVVILMNSQGLESRKFFARACEGIGRFLWRSGVPFPNYYKTWLLPKRQVMSTNSFWHTTTPRHSTTRKSLISLTFSALAGTTPDKRPRVTRFVLGTLSVRRSARVTRRIFGTCRQVSPLPPRWPGCAGVGGHVVRTAPAACRRRSAR